MHLAAVEDGGDPPADVELLTPAERGTERLMLGLRLDTPLELNGLAALVDDGACGTGSPRPACSTAAAAPSR